MLGPARVFVFTGGRLCVCLRVRVCVRALSTVGQGDSLIELLCCKAVCSPDGLSPRQVCAAEKKLMIIHHGAMAFFISLTSNRRRLCKPETTLSVIRYIRSALKPKFSLLVQIC